MADMTGRKGEENGNRKIWISRQQQKLFRWNQKHFHSYWRAHLIKNKNLINNSRCKLQGTVDDTQLTIVS